MGDNSIFGQEYLEDLSNSVRSRFRDEGQGHRIEPTHRTQLCAIPPLLMSKLETCFSWYYKYILHTDTKFPFIP